jgi:hypothetical protein
MDATATRIRFALVAFVFAVSTIVAACANDNRTRLVVGGSVLQPTAPFVGGFSVFSLIQPQFLSSQFVGPFGCPLLPPRSTSFEILVQQTNVDLFMNQVTLRFIDGSGVGGSPITFPRPDLNRMFGQTFVRANSFRSFPFTQRFGCFPVAPTVLAADLQFVDANGASHATSLTAQIQ